MGINVCIFSGNIVRDVDVRATKSGAPVAGFTIAVDVRKKVDGDWVSEPMYRECTLFGKRVPALSNYLVKGAKVVVKGHEEERSWINQETMGKQYKTVLMVEEIELFSTRKPSAPKPAGDLLDGDLYASDDLPF